MLFFSENITILELFRELGSVWSFTLQQWGTCISPGCEEGSVTAPAESFSSAELRNPRKLSHPLTVRQLEANLTWGKWFCGLSSTLCVTPQVSHSSFMNCVTERPYSSGEVRQGAKSLWLSHPIQKKHLSHANTSKYTTVWASLCARCTRIYTAQAQWLSYAIGRYWKAIKVSLATWAFCSLF